VLAQLGNVAPELAARVAEGLGMEVPPPLPLAAKAATPEVTRSPALSLLARPGDGSIATRKVAILIAPGVDGVSAMAVHRSLAAKGAVPRLLAVRLGTVEASKGKALEAEGTLETMASCTVDAVVIPDGPAAAQALCELGHAVDFIKDQYRHCKAILALGAGRALLEKASIPMEADDPALIVAPGGQSRAAIESFMEALAKHRNWNRATDPPPV
jgi:catalase